MIELIRAGVARTKDMAVITGKPEAEVRVLLMNLRRAGLIKHSKHTGWRLVK